MGDARSAPHTAARARTWASSAPGASRAAPGASRAARQAPRVPLASQLRGARLAAWRPPARATAQTDRQTDAQSQAVESMRAACVQPRAAPCAARPQPAARGRSSDIGGGLRRAVPLRAAARASSGGADYAALRVRELKKLLAERSIPAEGLFDKESIVQVRMGSKNGPGRCHGCLPCRLCRLREAGHPEDPAPSAHARPGCRRARSEPHAGGETAPPRAGATTERRSRRAGMRGHPVLAG